MWMNGHKKQNEQTRESEQLHLFVSVTRSTGSDSINRSPTEIRQRQGW